jgi:hypothetical protein
VPAFVRQALKRQAEVATGEEPETAMPQCAACGIAVPGLVTMPCVRDRGSNTFTAPLPCPPAHVRSGAVQGCAGGLCPECFKRGGCNDFELKRRSGRGSKPFCALGSKGGCRKKQETHAAWAPKQPYLELQIDETRREEKEAHMSNKVQAEQQTTARQAGREAAAAAKEAGESKSAVAKAMADAKAGEGTSVKAKDQPQPRPVPAVRAPPTLESRSRKDIEKLAEEIDAGSKVRGENRARVLHN